MTEQTGGVRFRALDGLRGVAAVVVVVHHVALAVPSIADAATREHAVGSGPWWWYSSPLRLVWAGEEAVLLFFVLSGFVLVGPALAPGHRWWAYYPRRLLRLYLPVWASLLLAVVLVLALPRPGAGEIGEPLAPWTRASVSSAPHDALLLLGTGGLNAPLWSLRWEVLFSLLLPAYLLLTRARVRGALAAVVVLVGCVAVGTATGVDALRFLPVFGLGVLLYAHRAAVLDVVERLARHSPAVWWVLAAGCAVLLTGRWVVDGLPVRSRLLEAVGSGAPIVGGCLAVVLALGWRPARDLLEGRLCQRLGRWSFSLYLVHAPILLALVGSTAGVLRVAVAAVLALVVSVAAAAVFARLVEGPSHRLAQVVGRRAGRPAVGR